MTTASALDKNETVNWVREVDNAPWQARDSQGKVVYKGRMWILGGWFNSFKPCPRDVWSTYDGRNWNLVLEVAPWKHSDLPMTLVYKDQMWFMGGWYNGRLPEHSASNEVWNSSDGANWKMASRNADWSPRLAAGAVVFKDKMWILGGIENYFFGDDASLKNDVWCSDDGRQWKLVTNNAGWSPRAFHQAVVFNGRMWIMGGGNYVPNHHALNDVWFSEDGANWTQATEKAAWGPRLWFSLAGYRNKMWVFGGWCQSIDNYGDVWFSENGRQWTELKSDVIWKSRHEHSAYVFHDKIWLAGGHARPLSSEVWSLTIPA